MIAKISGLHIRYDVKTKCEIVSTILNKPYQNKDQLVEAIKAQAIAYNVSYVAIRTWIGMYGDCYKLGMQLPSGVMSHSFTTINTKTEIKATFKELVQIRTAVGTLKSKVEKSNHPQYAKPKKKQTSTQILSGLFEELDKGTK